MASVSCLPMTECFRLKQYHNSRETAVQQPQVYVGDRRQNDARLTLATSVWLAGWYLLWGAQRKTNCWLHSVLLRHDIVGFGFWRNWRFIWQLWLYGSWRNRRFTHAFCFFFKVDVLIFRCRIQIKCGGDGGAAAARDTNVDSSICRP